jgi:uncharacterized protein (UPF0335 family)
MIDKLLRPFIPDQLKALCEKLESQDFDARSLSRIKNVLSELELTRFERYIVRRVYKRVRRVHDMNRVMEEIIIGQTEYNISMDINEKLRHAMDSGVYTGTMAAQQAAMWNGTVPPTTVTQARRVVARPKVSP